MINDQEIFKEAVKGGLIGAGLGLLLAGNNRSVGIGALAGAVLLATLKANENAVKSNVPVLVEEDGVIYEMGANGRKFIKRIEKLTLNIPSHFKLQ